MRCLQCIYIRDAGRPAEIQIACDGAFGFGGCQHCKVREEGAPVDIRDAAAHNLVRRRHEFQAGETRVVAGKLRHLSAACREI